MLIMFHQHCRWAYSASPLRSFCPLSELFFLFRTVFLYHQVVYDEVLSLGRILAHIILQELLHLVGLVQSNLLEAHVGADEVDKLVGTYLSKTFESGYLRVGTKLLYCLYALLVAVAIAGDEVALLAFYVLERLLVAHLRAAVSYAASEAHIRAPS